MSDSGIQIPNRITFSLPKMDVEAERVLEGESANVRETARASKSLEQFDDGLFALPANDEIHVAGVERGVRVEGRKVAAPNDGHLRMFLPELPAELDGRDHLRAGHDRDGETIDNLIMRRIPSRCANWLMAKLSGVDIHDFGTTFKAYRREVIHNIPLYGEMHRFIPALASWYGASICEIPIKNVNRERGKSHYGIGRTFRVFFDLMTIRFLLTYMSRPLHFFGTLGALGMVTGSIISTVLLGLKIANPHQSLMDQHGPMFVVGAVLIVAGIQMLAIGLLGELQVRHYYTSQHPASYTIERMVRLRTTEESGLLSERRDGNF